MRKVQSVPSSCLGRVRRRLVEGGEALAAVHSPLALSLDRHLKDFASALSVDLKDVSPVVTGSGPITHLSALRLYSGTVRHDDIAGRGLQVHITQEGRVEVVSVEAAIGPELFDGLCLFIHSIFDGAAVLLIPWRVRREGRATVTAVVEDEQAACGSELHGVLLAGPDQSLSNHASDSLDAGCLNRGHS